jgi:hypothetical protein
MAEALEDSAQRIAGQGRKALLGRLREAFEETAAAHTDVLELDPERLDQMVERAVDRADGLQWRRALASVATEELGIGLGEALGHPAVARAQEIVGAPSYEDGLAAIAEGNPPAPGSAAPEVGSAEVVAAEAGDERAPDDEAPLSAASGHLPVVVEVVHRQGLPALEGEGELELHFSEDGLKVVRPRDGGALASYAWTELDGIEVEARSGRLWRRRSARVVLSAKGLHGRFDAPDADPEELRLRLEPAVAKLGSGG